MLMRGKYYEIFEESIAEYCWVSVTGTTLLVLNELKWGDSLAFREITQLSVIVRILVSIIVGGLIGLERGMKHRPAGLRTYMLVCVGSSLIMLTNQYIFQFTGAGDPMRLGAQVVSGIGFLGAGTIVVTKHNQIKGLTTAAGLWASAGVGLAIGIGFYEAAITATVGIYAILTILQKWESKIQKKIRVLELYVELNLVTSVSEFTRDLRDMGFQIEGLQFETEGTVDHSARAIIVSVKGNRREDHSTLISRIKNIHGIEYLEEL